MRKWSKGGFWIYLILFSAFAMAEEPCASCGDEVVPDATTVLQAHGLNAASFTLLFSWTERAGDNATLVAGYHFQAASGNDTVDLYATLDGAPLDENQLRALGIVQKNWTPAPREQHAETPAQLGARASAAPPARARAQAIAARKVLSLPRLDSEEIATAKDRGRADLCKSSDIIGLVRDLPSAARITDADAAFGEWTTQADGTRVWAGAIQSTGAVAQRIHFVSLALPAGASIIVYDANDPAEVYGPFDGPAPGQNDLWAPSCFAETVAIECQVPAGATGVDFVIEKTGHVFKDYATRTGISLAGSCNLDFACYPDWATAGRGVAGIGSVNNAYVLFCTGSLLADTVAGTSIPYFLTANHCIRNATAASTAEFYWLYQRSSCGGTIPGLSTVPRTTGGATYLAGSVGSGLDGGGNDFTLLRMIKSPPDGLTWLGWSSTAPPVGTPITVIHHPVGDYKRISFGATAPYPDYGTLYHKVLYSEGTTEPGSSGSPLINSATGQIIGQLWGGYASCTEPDAEDYFGRFDVTYPLVAAWLDPIPKLKFVTASVNIDEGATAHVALTLSVYCGPLSVDYAVEAGTARVGTDYAAQSGTITFTGATAYIDVPALEDVDVDGDRTVRIVLSNPSGHVIITNNSLTLTFKDTDADQDGDGLSDQAETEGTWGYFSDPTLADTDGDGLSDSQEVLGAFGYVTDPADFDTDGDGYTDREEELRVHTDPTQYTAIGFISVPFFRETGF